MAKALKCQCIRSREEIDACKSGKRARCEIRKIETHRLLDVPQMRVEDGDEALVDQGSENEDSKMTSRDKETRKTLVKLS